MYERMLDLSEEPAYEEMTAHCRKAGALFERLNTALEEINARAAKDAALLSDEQAQREILERNGIYAWISRE